ncbi:hypothetical protein PBV87_08070 [Niameybacter massiliensis]|uniref:DUF5659 domain-containing protein n=1 Tax=Holtiella tumoricola TaxID=3018743 RepID=A0AA42J0S6_9FIRM|nr:hypothetical protein [Holtiella tumoricola]MDA3731431.1 hypothetical protein [Holtiella tumoricola]
MNNNIRRTYSLNLIAWLRSHNIHVQTYKDNHKIFGIYEETNITVLLKELYREDEQLHRFLNEFKKLKQTKVE